MKCPNCGFEIEKPNVKTCPCCGYKITRIETVPDEGVDLSETPSSASLPEEVPSNKTKDVHAQPTLQQAPEPAMVECPVCHTQIPNNTNFCPNCGNNMRVMYEQERDEATDLSNEQESAASEMLQTNVKPEYDTSSVSTPTVEQEKPATPSCFDNYRAEDTEQYVENGAYIPDEEDEGEERQREQDETPQKQETSSISQGVILVLTAIISIALGVLLYFVVNQ